MASDDERPKPPPAAARAGPERGISIRDLLAAAAALDCSIPILLNGFSGAGKEWYARLLHALSARADEEFLAHNCAATPIELAESILFGHERGAFSGADARRLGLFELARKGTLFLDEIADASPRVQAKLLRVVAERTVRRVGGTEDIPVHARLMFATHRDLRVEVEQGRFREDLYYRVAVITTWIPPLRERADEIPRIVEEILERRQAASSPPRLPLRVDADAMRILQGCPWPGNVRELQNVLLRVSVFCQDGVITPALLHRFGDLDVGDLPSFGPGVHAAKAAEVPRAAKDEINTAVRARYLEAVARVGSSVTKISKALGVSRQRVYRLQKKFGGGG
jgi:DNA-binding NtrC family response regulator